MTDRTARPTDASTSRRALLAGLGAAAVAGCLGRADPAETPVPPDSVDTDWPMPAADPGRSNAVPAASGPTEPVAELWTVSTEATPAAPVVADGSLYVGLDDGSVLALDARDGTERWRRAVGSPAGAPSVLGDTVYVPTASAVVALATGDGSEQWRAPAPAERDTLVADHGVYWVADATVGAIDRADGTERWRTDIRDPWEAHLFASPDTVFVSSGVHGPSPWRLAPGDGSVTGREPESGHDFAREVFYRDGVRYGLDPFFENVQARPLDGTTGWSVGLPPAEVAAIAGDGEQVYFVGSGAEEPGLSALAVADGSRNWHSDAVTSFRGRPVATGKCVLVGDDGALHCVDPADGSERWSLSGPFDGSKLAVADDLVYVSGDEGVRAFRPP